MPNTAKIVIVIVVILIILGGAYWWISGQYGASAPTTAQMQDNSGTAAAAPSASGLSGGNTNADLNQDLATIDSQMNNFASDSSSMSQSLNDQPVTQSQL